MNILQNTARITNVEKHVGNQSFVDVDELNGGDHFYSPPKTDGVPIYEITYTYRYKEDMLKDYQDLVKMEFSTPQIKYEGFDRILAWQVTNSDRMGSFCGGDPILSVRFKENTDLFPILKSTGVLDK